MTTPTRKGPPAFSPHELMRLYLEGRHDELSQQWLAILDHFEQTLYDRLDESGQFFINEFVKHFLGLFVLHDYRPGYDQQLDFIRHNLTIANLVALSVFETTDSYLPVLTGQDAEWGKRLALTSARNRTPVDRHAIFEADATLANVWFNAYGQIYRSGLVREDICARLGEHFTFQDPRIDPRLCSFDGYFAASYLDDGSDRSIKATLNQATQRLLGPTVLTGPRGPNPKKIAVITGNWFPAHSVYRILHGQLKTLGHFHLTLIQIGKRDVDVSLFDEVRRISYTPRGTLDLAPLRDNDFQLAYFPDVGLTPQSVILANLRVAPIQVAGLGHSVSTWGAKLDYFISGAEVEPTDQPERNYSERLVLLPGAGAIHNIPEYTPTGKPKSHETCLINAPWNAQKAHHRLVVCLKRILAEAKRPVRFRLFASGSLNRCNNYLAFGKAVREALGTDAVEVCLEMPYAQYMERMEEGEFSLDSYPFGGCNTVADSLHTRRLIVCREGDRWPSRIGPQMLRSIGLDELATRTDDQYVETAVRLINDPAYQAALQARLDAVDLNATIFSTVDAPAFARAIDHLIERHHSKRDDDDARSPIRIT